MNHGLKANSVHACQEIYDALRLTTKCHIFFAFHQAYGITDGQNNL